MFGYEDKALYHIYTSKITFENHVGLLILSNTKNLHYFLIKEFNRFMNNKTKHHGKNIFVSIVHNVSLAQ